MKCSIFLGCLLASCCSKFVGGDNDDWYSDEIYYPPCSRDVQCAHRCPQRGYLFGCTPFSQIRCSSTPQRPQFMGDWYTCGDSPGIFCSCPDNYIYVNNENAPVENIGRQFQQQQPYWPANNNNLGYGQPCSQDAECQAVMGDGGYCKREGQYGWVYNGICACPQLSHWYHGGHRKCYPLATNIGDFCMNDGHCRFVGPQARCNPMNQTCFIDCRGIPNCFPGAEILPINDTRYSGGSGLIKISGIFEIMCLAMFVQFFYE